MWVGRWHRSRADIFTLDFALRDLKSDEGEFGPVAEDGLGHRSLRGHLEEPEFGYRSNGPQRAQAGREARGLGPIARCFA